LGLDKTVTLEGTTVGAMDDYKEFCADIDATTSAPDVVYQVVLPNTCTFAVNFDDQGFNGAVAIRTVCDTRNTGADTCVNLAPDGETIKKELAAGTYFIVVDGGAKDAAGAFALTLSCTTPVCGDGVVNSAEEQCDPGPANPNDSCGDPGQANGCKILSAPFADTCADITTPIPVTTATPVFVPTAPPLESSLSGNDDYESPTCSNPGAGAPDQVYEFIPATSGTLTVTTGQNYNGQAFCSPPNQQPECFTHVLWFKSGDCENGAEISCVFSDLVQNNNVATLAIQVVAGTPYFLFVEGNSSDAQTVGENGPYLLKATLQ